MCRCSKRLEFDGALWCASDGVIDIHALLSGYLKAPPAGARRFAITAGLRAVRVTVRAWISRWITETESVKVKVLVNASGAWANVDC